MNYLRKALINIGALFFTLTVLVAFAGVVFRYMVNSSIVWAEEVIRFMFIWLFFLCLPEITRTGAHIGLDLLPTFVRGKAKIVLYILVELISNVFLVIIVYFGTKLAMTNMTQASPALQIPYGCVQFALPVGGVLMIVFSVWRIRELIKAGE